MSEDDKQGSGRSVDRLASATLGALRVGRDTPAPNVVEPDVIEPDVAESDVIGSDTVEPVQDDVATTDPVRLDKPAAPVTARTKSTPKTKVETESKPKTGSKPKSESKPKTESKPKRRASRWTMACALVAFLALAFAVVAGVLWWRAGHDSERRVGLARIQISKDAVLAIKTVNTSDYRKPKAALDNWLQVSTGSLHSQYSQSRSAVAKLLGEAKLSTKADVLDAAVTDVKLKKGVATVIASVNVTRTPVTGSPRTVRNRLRATMTRVGTQWKLSDLAPVPVSLS